jgi:coenzyme F420-0:L-glutamate ligase/coenzyme F420-1:gamma-L-glutamate ligase
MSESSLHIRGLRGIPEIHPGDDLSAQIVQVLHGAEPGSIFVVAQKVVSKSEGRIIPLQTVEPSTAASAWAAEHGRDARVVEIVLRESRRILRMERGIIIAETRHGYVCANAGVDLSNAPPGCVVLLPEDPDESARRLRDALAVRLEMPLGVIISDTFGRPWRMGLTNVALGVAGLEPLVDYRGQPDGCGRRLQATVLAAADELAAAAELVMGKNRAIPVAVIEGYDGPRGTRGAASIVRPAEEDIFR